VTLPSATTFHVPLRLDVGCGLHNGGLGVVVPRPKRPPDPRRVLRAALDLPATARAGATLDYVVTLTNPTARSVSLRHCPGYVEAVAAPPSTKLNFGLDCRRVPVMSPGQSVRFEMRLPVAGSTAPGRAPVVWSMTAFPGPSARGWVRIVR
jgi:hypothetical protein